MKKNVGKKFRLMALLTSLTLLLWGGVIACSNGSDDDGGNDKDTTSIKLKGAFFEEGDDDTPWVYCIEELKETTESGVWEGEITSVNSNGWDKFGLEINGTWYGAEDGITEIKDAKLVKNSDKNFWLATEKGGKTKVTVNLNTMTITAVDASQTSDTTNPPPIADDDDTSVVDDEIDKSDEETPSDDEEEKKPVVVTTVKLKGAFFEEGDDNTPWEYCSEELKETTESGVWEGEITSVNSGGWDKFGLEINGTWYGAEDGIAEIKDAKLVKDSGKNFWLATKKGGKTKVTVNLNKMTITAVDASQTSDTTTPPPTADDDDDNKEEKPSVVITSIKLNGAFNEDNDDWTDCSEQLKETESNVWEAEITAIKAWGKFKVVITEDGTDIWYGIKSDVTTPITNASLVKDDAVNIWLATEKNGKSKVTVNLNTMTITVAALSES